MVEKKYSRFYYDFSNCVVLILRKDFFDARSERVNDINKYFWLKFTITGSIFHLSFNFIGQTMPKTMYNLRGD